MLPGFSPRSLSSIPATSSKTCSTGCAGDAIADIRRAIRALVGDGLSRIGSVARDCSQSRDPKLQHGIVEFKDEIRPGEVALSRRRRPAALPRMALGQLASLVPQSEASLARTRLASPNSPPAHLGDASFAGARHAAFDECSSRRRGQGRGDVRAGGHSDSNSSPVRISKPCNLPDDVPGANPHDGWRRSDT
jgi:hypothetical protein